MILKNTTFNKTNKINKFQDQPELCYSTAASNKIEGLNQDVSQNQLVSNQFQSINYKQSLAKGISHPRIRQMIMNHEKISDLLYSSSNKCKQNLRNNFTNLKLLEQRKWLTKKGKKYLIDFDDNERKQMKDFFNSMDQKKTGSIGIDQLEELLISVGLMESREQVKVLIDSVDEDKSGKIQFAQFLKMILNDEGQNEEIVQFFKFIINSNRKKNQQQIEWVKNTKNNSKEKSTIKNCQKHSKKLIIQANLNNENPSIPSHFQKSLFHQKNQKRSKAYSSPDNQNGKEGFSKNSTLNIFERHPHPKNLPFGMIVSHIRRKHMLIALQISDQQSLNTKIINSKESDSDKNKSNNYLSNTTLKQSKASTNLITQFHSEEQIEKGQSVMNALRKMWDRRMLRELKEKKNKKMLQSRNCFLASTDKKRQNESVCQF